jgi:hypothetical protein
MVATLYQQLVLFYDF